MRGLYILPAAGFLLIVAATVWLGTSLDGARRIETTAATLVVGTPLLFYGLEFWEHAPAVGLATLALALLLRDRPLSSGLAFGLAVLLRPEALWVGVASLAAAPLLGEKVSRRAWVVAGAALLVTLAPLAVYGLVHYGSVVPLHIRSNVANLDQGWWAGRLALLSLWFGRGSDASFWRVAPAVVCALATLALSPPRRGRAFLWTVAIVDLGLTLATAPNEGGAQWGPRYALFAYVPLAILAADGIELLPPKRVAAAVTLAILLLGGAWIQRNGYRLLRGTKITYGRVVDFVAAEAPSGGYVMSDLWWLDQIAATALDGRIFLFVYDSDDGRGIVKRLDSLPATEATVIRSSVESPDTSSWSDGTCFKEVQRDSLSTRNLIAIRLTRSCSQ